MQFVLHYRGPLRGNSSGPEHKHAIRREFHAQLAELWKLEPLSGYNLLGPKKREGDVCSIREKPPYTFAPLVTGDLKIAAELQIIMLRREKPGGLIKTGGDIDNRVKTLFDALAMPQHAEDMPKEPPSEAETPFYCLLEDDALVTSVAVEAERWLGPVPSEQNYVEALLRVRVRPVMRTFGNFAFGG